MNSETGLSPTHSRGRASGSTIHFTVTGLIALCASLVGTSIFATRQLDSRRGIAAEQERSTTAEINRHSAVPAAAPWGDLVTLDVEIQQPEEYVSFDTTTAGGTKWVFPGRTVNQVKEALGSSGLTESQISAALAPDRVVSSSDATTLKPDEALVLSFSADVRGKLYGLLAQWPENKFMNEPYHLPGTFAAMAVKSGVSPEVIGLIGKLTYHHGDLDFFSDPEIVLSKIKTDEERLHLLKALTYQTAVLARLRLTKNSDIDKIVGYWGSVPGVRAKDLHPLLESVARTPDGGTLSLLYLLPQFARERLFTFPLPSQTGDTRMDCHWTALNFLNSTPDDRLQDPAYASGYIKQHFYQVGKPSKCGDVMFVLDAKGGVIHSAVYIADDIVFTKNGINYAQPWILMRMKSLLDVYTKSSVPNALYYRRKEA
jgi:hypothetical protein